MKKINGKRLAALALAGILSASLLTGCGGSGTKQASTTEFDKNLVYKATYYNKPEDFSYLGNATTGMDGKIYAQGYSNKEQKEVAVRMNPDNGEIEKIIPIGSDEGNAWTMCFEVDADGNIWKMMNSYVENKEEPEKSKTVYYLTKSDSDGKELLKKELKQAEESFYPNDMVIDKNGNVIMGGNNQILGYDQNGEQIFKIDTTSYVENLAMDAKGDIYIINYSDDYTQRIFNRVDTQGKQLVEVRRIDAANMLNLISGKDTFYLNDGIYMYTYNIETDEKVKILNWINSDINGANTYSITALPDGRFVGTVYDELKQENQIMVVEKVAPEDVKDKKLLTLAMPYTDYNMNIAVIAFNKQNEEYRIVIDDYSQYATSENYNAGVEKMDTDLISGKVPDLVSVSNLATGKYINKGLFADLYAQMEQDSSFNRSDYMENIFKAYERDGKLYTIIPGFNIQTVIAKEENVGKTPGWTLEDLEKLVAEKPEGTKIFDGMTQESVLYQGLFLSIDQYINYNEGSCSFDSEDFIKLLNFAKQFPKASENGDGGIAVTAETVAGEVDENSYANDKILLQTYYLYNYEQVHDTKYYNFGGKDITFIGFPTANKQGSAISSSCEVAMSAKTAYPEGAWAFIKYLLSDEYQGSRSYEWPVKKSAYTALKEKAQKPETYIDENGKEQVYEQTTIINGKEVKIGRVTDEEMAKVDELLNSVTQIMRYDAKVNEIITEESGAFFTDQKSAEEVGKLIQNRVQTYLSETQ